MGLFGSGFVDSFLDPILIFGVNPMPSPLSPQWHEKAGDFFSTSG